ncbi:hypothetical protein PoB_002551900 [Plakobranchus ocellatus]|uniref:Uncharacterized protein n=1 Tax=Plakobranchus ocellatus TaxID=259542 RepID=A0AAV3ZUJ5_9GAST|nr:hypothetical protein PoB_002551900 [Plakobranchus ocellatus]
MQSNISFGDALVSVLRGNSTKWFKKSNRGNSKNPSSNRKAVFTKCPVPDTRTLEPSQGAAMQQQQQQQQLLLSLRLADEKAQQAWGKHTKHSRSGTCNYLKSGSLMMRVDTAI